MDRCFLHIKFKADGVDVKMSPMGINFGATIPGASLMAEHVKSEHTRRLGRKSPIVAALLALQIQAHAVAYVGCDAGVVASFVISPVAGPLAARECAKVKRHANPVNASWLELGVFKTTGLGLDR